VADRSVTISATAAVNVTAPVTASTATKGWSSMISYGELVLLPEWTLMPLSLLLDDDAVWVHPDGRHVSVGSHEPVLVYTVVGWDHYRAAVILRRCPGPPGHYSCRSLLVHPADIPPVQDESREVTDA
jgi:hypothetical protein